MDKIIRLETVTEDGQSAFTDINIGNFTYTTEYNGEAVIHFPGGDTITVGSGVWQMIKDEWARDPSVGVPDDGDDE